MKREVLEGTVLDGLQHHLMDPALMELFCEEYTPHRSKLAAEQNAAITDAKAEQAKVTSNSTGWWRRFSTACRTAM